jgi:RNA polymerase sigma-70 factor (sigma-E family)
VGVRKISAGLVQASASEGSAAGVGNRLANLYGTHSKGAVRFAYLLTGDLELAQDLTQDAFIRVFGRFGDKRAPEAFTAYLRRTIVNLARDHWRRRVLEMRHTRRERSLARPATAELPDTGLRDQLWQALYELPVRQRAVLILRHYDDLSEQQTAQVLGCSVGAVKALSTRGLSALRDQIRGDTDE